MAKLNVQHHYSSLHCHMILQKSFEYVHLVIKKHFWLFFKILCGIESSNEQLSLT